MWALLFQFLKPSFPSSRHWKLINILQPSLSSKYRPSSDHSFSMYPSVLPFFPTFQALHLSNTDFINPSCFTASDILIYCSISLDHFSLSICFFCALEQTIHKEIKSRVAGVGVSSTGPFPSRSFIGWFPQSTILYRSVHEQRVRWSVMVVQISRDHAFEIEWKYLLKSGLLLEKSGSWENKSREPMPKEKIKGWMFPTLLPDPPLWDKKGSNQQALGVHKVTLAARKHLQVRRKFSLLGTSLSTSRLPK